MQLTFPLSPRPKPSLANFIATDPVLAQFIQVLPERLAGLARGETLATAQQLISIRGPRQSGKTHLLQALQEEHGQQVGYFDLQAFAQFEAQQWQGFWQNCDTFRLLCLDNIDQCYADPMQARALFNCINQVLEAEQMIILSFSRDLPSEQSVLPDLQSRLSWGQQVVLQALNDQQLRQALSIFCREIGLNVKEAVLDYLITHCQRDISRLKDLIATWDAASLAEGKGITIPFIKSQLAQH